MTFSKGYTLFELSQYQTGEFSTANRKINGDNGYANASYIYNVKLLENGASALSAQKREAWHPRDDHVYRTEYRLSWLSTVRFIVGRECEVMLCRRAYRPR